MAPTEGVAHDPNHGACLDMADGKATPQFIDLSFDWFRTFVRARLSGVRQRGSALRSGEPEPDGDDTGPPRPRLIGSASAARCVARAETSSTERRSLSIRLT
jgi:hypothetical protein